MSSINTADMYRHVEGQAEILVRRVKTWLAHPTFDTQTALRQYMSEIEGMWSMTHQMAEFPPTLADTPQYHAIIKVDRARRVIRHLDALAKDKYSIDIDSL